MFGTVKRWTIQPPFFKFGYIVKEGNGENTVTDGRKRNGWKIWTVFLVQRLHNA